MTANRSFAPLRYDVVKDCAEELIRMAGSGDIEARSAVEMLRERVPAANGQEMRMALEVALECILGLDDDEDDAPDR